MFAPPVAKVPKAAASPTNRLVSQRSTLVARPIFGGAAEQAPMLRKGIGNEAALRPVWQRARNVTENEPRGHIEQEADPASLTTRRAMPGRSWDIGKIPLYPPEWASRTQPLFPLAPIPLPGAMQAKLVVGHVNDPLEHEADRVADQVMRIPGPDPSVTSAPPRLSRVCSACEEEERPNAKRSSTSGAAIAQAPDVVDDVLRSSGQPLDPGTRAFFEPRFRRDFGGVRIHAGARAAESAVAVSALAYTVGEHIVFGADRYAPSTEAGRTLLAHELAHVTQQRPKTLARQPAPSAAPATPQSVINDANTRRIGTLLYAISELSDVISTVQAGLAPNPYTFTVQAIQSWLHVGPGDAAFVSTVQAANNLYLRNLQLTPRLLYQSNTVQVDPAGNACPANLAYSRGGVGPIYFCDNFIAKGPNCQRDVMIHEHFHLLGMAVENYGAPTTRLALDSPDSLSQLAAEIADGPHTASCLGSG